MPAKKSKGRSSKPSGKGKQPSQRSDRAGGARKASAAGSSSAPERSVQPTTSAPGQLGSGKGDRYYVYALVDPQTAAWFYVGKGCGKRAWTHLMRNARSYNGRKSRRIHEIRAAGHEPVVQVIEAGMAERAALDLERLLIRERRESLTNIASGGHPTGPRISPGLRAACDATRLLLSLPSEDEILRIGPVRLRNGEMVSVQRRLWVREESVRDLLSVVKEGLGRARV